MNDLVITGIGAVSPAGWNVATLLAALDAGQGLPTVPLLRPGWDRPLPARRVPPPSPRPAFLAHPRLRRASPLSQFAVAAALEALGQNTVESNGTKPVPGADRLGLVFCTMTGSVIYSRRFFEEALRDPSTASPLLFPETVFNAPASHTAAVLGIGGRVQTEIGDSGCFLKALNTAGLWLRSEVVDRCLVVAAEELDWLICDGASLVSCNHIAADGAGALLIERTATIPGTIALARIAAVSDAQMYSSRTPPAQAVRAVRESLSRHVAGDTLLADSTGGGGLDRAEKGVWRDWSGPRLSPKRVLGEGFAAGAAWQCIAAVQAIARGRAGSAIISVVGPQEQAIGAVFSRPDSA